MAAAEIPHRRIGSTSRSRPVQHGRSRRVGGARIDCIIAAGPPCGCLHRTGLLRSVADDSEPARPDFKAVFGQPEHARGALRAILPAVLAEALDWSTLTLQPGSFVDTALSQQHTDLLYAATWRDGGEALVY